VSKMNLTRLRKLIQDENLHRFILIGFRWGKNTIIYGSIFSLTVLGIIVWFFGILNLFFLVGQSIVEWGFSHSVTTSALQQLETNAILLLDLFLLSVVLFIVAIGLYGIFVKKEEGGITLPVEITKISQLERYLFGTIVTMLLVAALNKILYPSNATPPNNAITIGISNATPPNNAITIGMICAIVLVISIYLAVQRPEEQ
jgi:uncharacterized membrane protein YqhA